MGRWFAGGLFRGSSGYAPAGLLVHPCESRSCRSSSRIGGPLLWQAAGNRAAIVAFHRTSLAIVGSIALLCDHATSTDICEGHRLHAYAVSYLPRLPSLRAMPAVAEGGRRPGTEHLAWPLRACRHPGGERAAVPLGGTA